MKRELLSRMNTLFNSYAAAESTEIPRENEEQVARCNLVFKMTGQNDELGQGG